MYVCCHIVRNIALLFSLIHPTAKILAKYNIFNIFLFFFRCTYVGLEQISTWS